MSIPTFSTDTNVIQQLADRPNDTNGLSAAALKAKFDEASGGLKTYINGTLLPYLESASAAGDLGVDDSVLSMGVSNIQAALEALQAAITSASVPDGGISTAKLADGSVTTAKLAASAVTTAKINDGAVTAAKLALPIYVVDEGDWDPSSPGPDGIYLVCEE